MATIHMYSRTLLICFLLFLVLPGIIMLSVQEKEISEAEKRPLAELPVLDGSLESIQAFPDRFNTYFNDHFGLRDFFITLHNSAYTRLFNSSPNRNVIWGKDGWLYLASSGNFSDFLGQGITEHETIVRFGNELADRKKWLEQKNIRYLFVPVPNKIQIYPEYLPGHFTARAGVSMLNQLTRHADSRGAEIPLLDLVPTLEAAKQEEQVYYRSDTHWNYAGAYRGYSRIIHHLGNWFPEQRPLTRKQFATHRSKYPGDLASMLHLEKVIEEYDEYPTVQKPCHGKGFSRIVWPYGNEERGGETAAYLAECYNKPLTVFILQDSFGRHPSLFFAQQFGKTYVFPGSDFRDMVPWIEEIHPDLVIDLHVARNVPQALKSHRNVKKAVAKQLFKEAPHTIFNFSPGGSISQPVHPVNASLSPEGIVLAENNDPQLILSLPPLEAFKDLTVHISMSSPENSVAQIFYDNQQAPSFSEKHSHSFTIQKGKNHIYLRAPFPDTTTSIRFDPGNTAGTYTLSDFTIKGFQTEPTGKN